VLGVLSLILWALAVVVTAKYVLVLLRADNNGEGGMRPADEVTASNVSTWEYDDSQPLPPPFLLSACRQMIEP
jgi:hypothetical protein